MNLCTVRVQGLQLLMFSLQSSSQQKTGCWVLDEALSPGTCAEIWYQIRHGKREDMTVLTGGCCAEPSGIRARGPSLSLVLFLKLFCTVRGPRAAGKEPFPSCSSAPQRSRPAARGHCGVVQAQPEPCL